MSATPPPQVSFEDIVNQLQLLTQQNQDLQRRLDHVDVSPARATPAPEPKVQLPEKFSGKRTELRNFLSAVENVFALQPRRYSSARAKTGLIGSLCSGNALSWFRVLQDTQAGTLEDYSLFVNEFKTYFGDPFLQENARRQLTTLVQGKTSAATYASKFRQLAVDTEFDDSTLRYHYELGLNAAIRQAIAVNDVTFSTLEGLIAYSIKVDNRLFDLGRRMNLSSRSDSPRSDSPRPTPTPQGPTPMEIGSISISTPRKLTDEEKQARRQQGLCLYCGKPGHLAKSCPAKKAPPKNSK